MASTGGLVTILERRPSSSSAPRFLPEEPSRSAAAPAAPAWRSWPAARRRSRRRPSSSSPSPPRPESTTWWSQNTGYMPVRKSAIDSEEMQDFFAENPNFKTAVDQLPKTQPQDAARVFDPERRPDHRQGVWSRSSSTIRRRRPLRRCGPDAHRRGPTGHRGAQSHRLDLAHRDDEERRTCPLSYAAAAETAPLGAVSAPRPSIAGEGAFPTYWSLSGTVLARE